MSYAGNLVRAQSRAKFVEMLRLDCALCNPSKTDDSESTRIHLSRTVVVSEKDRMLPLSLDTRTLMLNVINFIPGAERR
jgi:hypothetical protein